MGSGKKARLRIGSKNRSRRAPRWSSDWVQPAGKYWKRNAAKAARHGDIPPGKAGYKRMWGWFEWS